MEFAEFALSDFKTMSNKISESQQIQSFVNYEREKSERFLNVITNKVPENLSQEVSNFGFSGMENANPYPADNIKT